MFLRLLVRMACAGLLALPCLRAEDNAWPFFVRRTDPAVPATADEYIGPLFFAQSRPGEETSGFRPFYMQAVSGNATEANLLYPLFVWRQQPGFRSFSFFQLVNFRATDDDPADIDRHFDVWPVYFSRRSADPDESYRAVFPLGGTLKHRFGKDRISFVVFPLYARTVKSGKVTTHAPWPFLRFIGGENYRGFEFWPLGGHQGRAGDYDYWFALWPLVYRSATHLDEAVPTIRRGFLPFYASDTGPGVRSETFAWPFFGYTERTAPYHYHEKRYFWPLLVQGRGDDRRVNRWAPLYSHSNIKGYDKTWIGWPIFRHVAWEADGLAQSKDQFLFFVYWSLEQRSATNPNAAPARKTHLWPLYSSWDNGAGRRQVQALSPFEIFLPNNGTVRQLWTPLFALYRYDQQPDGTTRHAFLWNAITSRRSPASREFHLGPLLSVTKDEGGSRVSFGRGLFGWQRHAGERTRGFLFDFRMKAANTGESAPSP